MAVDVESVLAKDIRMFGSRPRLRKSDYPKLLYGTGFLAGRFPDGITTVDGAPVSATVRVVLRSGDPALDGLLLAEVASGNDGTWRVDNLNPNLRYDVIGRKPGFNDVIMANVAPSNPPRLFDSWVKAYIGLPLDHTFRTFGGVEPVVVTKTAGALPDGISHADGQLTADWPTGAPGDYPVTFTTTDANGDSTDKTLFIELILLALEMTASAEPPTMYLAGRDIQPITFAASGGEGPYTFGTTGALPDGIAFDPATKELSGNPATEGAYSFAVQATDVRGTTVEQAFSVEVVTPIETFDSNLALNKSLDSNNDISFQNSSSSPVNGNVDTNNYTSYGSGEAWLSVDLGAIYNINQIHVWFYWSDGRTYHDKRVQYSVDGIEWVSVYDDTVDPVYAETADGKEFVFTKDAARYVRVVTNGSTSNGGNHVIEIEARLTSV